MTVLYLTVLLMLASYATIAAAAAPVAPARAGWMRAGGMRVGEVHAGGVPAAGGMRADGMPLGGLVAGGLPAGALAAGALADGVDAADAAVSSRGAVQDGARATDGDPDALYAQRADLVKARRAADTWAARLKQQPQDFESAWKLSRALYWLGGHGPEAARQRDLEAGVQAGQTAATLQPKRPEGYFWSAANMGSLAESYGLRAGLKYRKPIREALEQVLRLDPAFQDGSADRALGRWYYKVPGLFGGSKDESEAHLRKSLTYDPQSTASHYFLAETLLDQGRKSDARAELQKVLDAPINPNWAPEDQEFKQKAQTLLTQIGRR
jgi:tetratricopeptide (TPR) repeat protein